MTDPREASLARILTEYSLKLEPGELVAVQTGVAGASLAKEVYRSALAAGAIPYMLPAIEDVTRILLAEGNPDQIKHVSRVDRMVREEFDASVSILSATNTRLLSGVDPERQQMRSKAYTDLRETFMERSASGDFRWVLTMYPTEAYAQDADMSQEAFADFVYAATYADADDPVGAWQAVHDEQQRLVDWLADKKQLAVKGPDVDLTLSIEGRVFVNSDGTHNMPSGEIFTGPVEDSVNGWVRFAYPAVTAGREVDGIELRFEDGKVVDASATKNEDFLISTLDTDDGARYLGEWAIGTNKMVQQFTKNILFDEKIGGTIHMAVGAGYPETGSKNKSAVHWDMICEMRNGGTIAADGEVFYDAGEFLI